MSFLEISAVEDKPTIKMIEVPRLDSMIPFFQESLVFGLQFSYWLTWRVSPISCSNLDKNRKNIEVQIDDANTLTIEMHCFHISKCGPQIVE